MSGPALEAMIEVHLARALRWQKHVFSWVFADFGLETYEYHALLHLGVHDGIQQGALGAILLRDKVSTSRLLVELEKKGLVERRDDPVDTRAKRVHLTAKGKRLLQKVRVVQRAASRRVAAGFTAHEQGELVRLLEKLQVGYRAAATAFELPLPEEMSS
jgi:MarR family transcriptional regulator for hemolysin